jgi:hypothetical protein
VDIAALLENARSEILDEAFTALEGSDSSHYERAGEPFTRQKLADLFDLVAGAIRHRDLDRIEEYAASVARDRYTAGFDISEVQAAFNGLERTCWHRLVADVPHDELARAVGLLSTVLGAGKDVLARTYVSLATERHVPSLDLTALFDGSVA